jgi:hypothetical protein
MDLTKIFHWECERLEARSHQPSLDSVCDLCAAQRRDGQSWPLRELRRDLAGETALLVTRGRIELGHNGWRQECDRHFCQHEGEK